MSLKQVCPTSLFAVWRLQALIIEVESSGTATITSTPTRGGRHFTLAHELCHLLFDRSVGQRLAVASGPWAPPSLEQRANAFAAMLLMPTEAVRAVVAGMNEAIATEQGISSIARRLETGFSATLWHLRNLGFVDDSSVQRIEAERQRL